MEPTPHLQLHATPHPTPEVRRIGFDLTDPYIEQCWSPVLGPTSILLLRRLPILWQADLSPTIEIHELSASLGLGYGEGRHCPVLRTLDRLVRFRFANHAGPGQLDVFTHAPPVPDHHLNRLPTWTRTRHDHLLTQHIDQLAAHLTPIHSAPSLHR